MAARRFLERHGGPRKNKGDFREMMQTLPNPLCRMDREEYNVELGAVWLYEREAGQGYHNTSRALDSFKKSFLSFSIALNHTNSQDQSESQNDTPGNVAAYWTYINNKTRIIIMLRLPYPMVAVY